MRYVDGYLLPVPKNKLTKYQKVASKAGKIWIQHGALQYCEAAGEDLQTAFGMPFPKQMKTKPGETVIFAFVIYKSRAHRDKVNKKVFADPRLNQMIDPKDPLFNMKRMCYGGFTTLVDLVS